MKLVILFLLFFSFLGANIDIIPSDKTIEVKGKFAKNKRCIRCHLTIYKEFKYSSHHKSNILNNPMHKAIWKGNPLSKKQKYICASCHAPAAQQIDTIMSGKSKIKKDDKSISDGISCAFCHRIENIHKGKKKNSYILSKKKREYFGTRKPLEESEFHDIVRTNKIYKSGDVCFVCHAMDKKEKTMVLHKKQSYCVFTKVDKKTAKKAKNSKKQNCIKCHMPQVEGSVSDRGLETNTHTYHGFSIFKRDPSEYKKYIDIDFKNNTLTIQNKMPHNLVQHPTRLYQLRLLVGGKVVKVVEFKKESIDKDIKPFIWLKNSINHPQNLEAKSKKSFTLEQQINKDDKVEIIFGYYRLNPKIAKEIDFKDKNFTEFKTLITKKIK